METANSSVFLYLAIVILIAALIAFLLRKRNRGLSAVQQSDLLDITSGLVEYPVLIISDDFTVQYINQYMKKYIAANVGNSLKKISKKPFIKIDGIWRSLSDLIQIYRLKAIDDLLYLAEVAIRTQNDEKVVNIRIYGTDHHFGSTKSIGIAIFNISDKSDISKIHFQNTTTGLPNHNRALADIGLMVNSSLSSGKKFAVAVISIDHFLEIVTVIGYNESLAKVVLIAKYLQEVSVKKGFSLYHMTSNNFLLVIPEIESTQEGVVLVEKYKTDCENLLHRKNPEIHFTISSGISIYPDNDIENLINGAYRALLSANKQGDGCTIVVEPDKRTKLPERTVEYKEIKNALENDQFSIYYQPIYSAELETVVGAEALVRWIHPTKGVVPPGLFLPLVEKTGFMKQLSTQIAVKVITQLATWKKHGFKKIQVSINLSMREFEAGDFHDILYALLEKNSIDSAQLKVEITENVAMSNEKYTREQFQKLKHIGIDISLDDFGMGYSSFSMLRSLPIDTVKIDRSFVTDMIFNKDHQAIVKAMIAMAHSLGLKVVAEGIEDMQTKSILDGLGCDYLQGYFLGKPMPTYEFQELIRTDRQLSISDDIIPLEDA